MKRFLTENILWKLLSVLLAFLLWVAVAQQPEVSTYINAPILFRNMPENLDVASETPERVRLYIRGPAPRLSPENLAQTAVIFDLATVMPGERTFTIGERNVRQLPAGVSFSRAMPSQISLLFEHVVSKEVPIEPTYGRSPKEGYLVTGYAFDPPQVRIAGPESRVNIIDHVTTDPIDLSGVQGQKPMHAHLRSTDPQVRLEGSSLVQFIVTVDKVPKRKGE